MKLKITQVRLKDIKFDETLVHLLNIKLGHLVELMDSIRNVGLVNPLFGYRESKQEPVRLVNGHYRFLAAHILGLKKVPMYVNNKRPPPELYGVSFH